MKVFILGLLIAFGGAVLGAFITQSEVGLFIGAVIGVAMIVAFAILEANGQRAQEAIESLEKDDSKGRDVI